MNTKIEIDLDVYDRRVLDDIVKHLETVLPYMADNVLVRSKSIAYAITGQQRSALFAAFAEVFGDTHGEVRHAFTRLVLGKDQNETVSWSDNKPGAITAAEASSLLDALDALRV